MAPIREVGDRTREFVTRLAIDVYEERGPQRSVATFVTVACALLDRLYEMGGLHLRDNFSMGDLVELSGNLHVFWFASIFNRQLPREELAVSVAGIGYSYHLSDESISDWQSLIGECVGPPFAIGRMVARFDRVVEHIAKIWGANYMVRSSNWIELLGDITKSYKEMMSNPQWIQDLDATLDRAK